MALFEEAGVALVAPFKRNGEVNYGKLEGIVEEQVAGDTDATITCGTTDEASTMTHEERLDVVEYICRVTKKRTPVVAGTGSNYAETAVYLSAGAGKRGADRLLLVSPCYNKATQKGFMAHFTTVVDAIRIPVTLYNIPGRAGVTTRPETIAALCRDVDNIMGVKEASGNFSAIATLISLPDDRMDLYSGNDDQIMPLLSLGGEGVISVLSSVAPRQTHNICASYFAGDVKTSATLQLKAIPLITELFSEINPIPIKAAMSVMDEGVGLLRMPLTEVEPQSQEKLEKTMAACDILQGRLRKRTVYQW